MKEFFSNKDATVGVLFFSKELERAFEQVVEKIVGEEVKVDVLGNLERDLDRNEYYELFAEIYSGNGKFSDEQIMKLENAGISLDGTEQQIFNRLIELLVGDDNSYAIGLHYERERFKIKVNIPYKFYKEHLDPEVLNGGCARENQILKLSLFSSDGAVGTQTIVENEATEKSIDWDKMPKGETKSATFTLCKNGTEIASLMLDGDIWRDIEGLFGFGRFNKLVFDKGSFSSAVIELAAAMKAQIDADLWDISYTDLLEKLGIEIE